jgi:hypothetical protein
MIDIKPTVYAALIANTALVALLGTGIRITQIVAPNAELFPRITFFELTNGDSLYLDDAAFASEIGLQIDIWSKGDTSAIAIKVDITMKSLSFKRVGGADFYESDTKIYHKALRYETNAVI